MTSANARQAFEFEDPEGPDATRFRREYRLDAYAASGTEMDILLRLAEWTYGQFFLFGRPSLTTENAFEILPASARGHRFYCAHYAIVFCAAVTALGWTARLISLRRAGEIPRHSNHNVVEVWSKERNRWICFDPTYGGCLAVEGEPVCAYDAAREWFTREGRVVQFLLGPRRQPVNTDDFPYLLREYPDYGWTRIDERSLSCYACIAWVPSNRVFGAHGRKSIETWNDWPGMYIHFGDGKGWECDASALPPYQ